MTLPCTSAMNLAELAHVPAIHLQVDEVDDRHLSKNGDTTAFGDRLRSSEGGAGLPIGQLAHNTFLSLLPYDNRLICSDVDTIVF